MVTFTKRYETFTVGKVYCDGDCLSTDTKPTKGIANGSKLYEMDTGKRYMFDEENSTWIEVSTGEGGGSSSEWLVVNKVITNTDGDIRTELTKTWAQINGALTAGVPVCMPYTYETQDDNDDTWTNQGLILNIGTAIVDGKYVVTDNDEVDYSCDSENEYPYNEMPQSPILPEPDEPIG